MNAWETSIIACNYSTVFLNVCVGVLCAALVVLVWYRVSKEK